MANNRLFEPYVFGLKMPKEYEDAKSQSTDLSANFTGNKNLMLIPAFVNVLCNQNNVAIGVTGAEMYVAEYKVSDTETHICAFSLSSRAVLASVVLNGVYKSYELKKNKQYGEVVFAAILYDYILEMGKQLPKLDNIESVKRFNNEC